MPLMDQYLALNASTKDSHSSSSEILGLVLFALAYQ